MQQKDYIFSELDWLGIFRKILDLVEEERREFQRRQFQEIQMKRKREKLEDENKTSISNNKFLTTEELSEFLQVPKSWVYGRTYRNEIPPYKLGRPLRFDLNKIQEWLAEHRND